MNPITCPKNLNQFLLGEPLFENTFPEEECEERQFYGDCFHCWASAIAKRDKQLTQEKDDEANPHYTLVGVDGNAFNIMAYTARALKNEGLGNLTDQMYAEATAGAYYQLINVCSRYIDKANMAAKNRGKEK